MPPAPRWRSSAGSTDLLTALEDEPAGLLRSGGLGVRDQKRLAKELRISEGDVAFLAEWRTLPACWTSAGPQRDEWLPTRGYDAWREQDLTDRWAVLAWGWLTSARLISLVGQRDVAGKAVNVLSPDVVRQTAPVLRRSALSVLGRFPPGDGPRRSRSWWRCCAGAPRAGPTGSRRCPTCWPRRSGLGVAARRGAQQRRSRSPRRWRGRRRRRDARAAPRAGRPRARPAGPVADRPGAAGGRPGRHAVRRRRRGVLRWRDGLPGLRRPASGGPWTPGGRPATCTTSSAAPRAPRCRRPWSS